MGASSAPQAASTSPYFTGACADMWEGMLVANRSQWLLGSELTQADAQASRELAGKKPNPKTHPNLFAWAAMVTKFSDVATGKWATGELPRPANAVAEQTK